MLKLISSAGPLVDVATSAAWRLSQPRWDAWFALSPDGKRLLLGNGRGGFWVSELVFAPDACK